MDRMTKQGFLTLVDDGVITSIDSNNSDVNLGVNSNGYLSGGSGGRGDTAVEAKCQ